MVSVLVLIKISLLDALLLQVHTPSKKINVRVSKLRALVKLRLCGGAGPWLVTVLVLMTVSLSKRCGDSAPGLQGCVAYKKTHPPKTLP